MTTSETTPGKTTVATGVLSTIAQLAATSVPGVSRLAAVAGSASRLFRRGASEGVLIEVEDDLVYADLFLILKADVNIREVSRNVQLQVSRAIQEMVGMEIGAVDIHIQDIDFGADGAAT
jgi:uncharacterized alkaline shock family protein YloU